jgi:type IV secretory pathway protease TraF
VGQPGRIAVARPPAGFPAIEPVIERIAAVPGDRAPASVRPVVADDIVPTGMVVLLGDSRASTDSRRWGLVPIDHLLGVVVTRLGTAAP